MEHIFTIPDKDRNPQAHMVCALTYIWTAATTTTIVILSFYFPDVILRSITFIGASLFIAFITLILIKRGFLMYASWLFTLMQWLFFTLAAYTSGGIIAPGIIIQMSVILSAGILLGWRGALVLGVLTIIVDFWLAYIETVGLLPVPMVVHTPITRWLTYFIPFGTTLALQYYATNHLRANIKTLKREVAVREELEKVKDQTLFNLQERIKELQVLYKVNQLLQDEVKRPDDILQEIVQTIPLGFQFPDLAHARVNIENNKYLTKSFRPSDHLLTAHSKTKSGRALSISVGYIQETPQSDEGPFLTEERSMINMLAEMLKTNLDRREQIAELKDYKYALDTAALVYIIDVQGNYCFVNDNFCKVSQYDSGELLGQPYTFLDVEIRTEDYSELLMKKMKDGSPYRIDVCNRAKDGSLFWVDRTIVPFLDPNGIVYQYLSINQDITERMAAAEKVAKNEQLLKKITSQVHGNTYMFEINEKGLLKMLFLNRGIDEINHTLDLSDTTRASQELVDLIHDDDKPLWRAKMKEGFETMEQINFQYRIWFCGNLRWRWFRAVPEKDADGHVIWYGAAQDITPLVEYITSIEQIIFDISHVIRRPIASLLGITTLIIENDLNEEELRELLKSLKLTAQEMDKFLHELNVVYHRKRQSSTLNIDISALIDKRTSIFGS